MPLPIQTAGPVEEKPTLPDVSPSSASTATERIANISSTIGGVQGPGGGSNGAKGDAEIAAEKLYEERMEEEYAKREGGA